MSRIATKISQLIAQADSTSHPEEAHTFMAKAHAMLEKHGLTLLDLGKLDEDDPLRRLEKEVPKSYNSGWQMMLATTLASYYGCELIYGPKRWDVFGRESATVTFELMWPYVHRQVMALAIREFGKGMYSSRSKARIAIGKATIIRIARMVRENKERSQSTATGRELVPVDMIEAFVRETFPHLRTGKSRSLRTDSHATSVAKEISLNRQTSAPAGTLRIA